MRLCFVSDVMSTPSSISLNPHKLWPLRRGQLSTGGGMGNCVLISKLYSFHPSAGERLLNLEGGGGFGGVAGGGRMITSCGDRVPRK